MSIPKEEIIVGASTKMDYCTYGMPRTSRRGTDTANAVCYRINGRNMWVLALSKHRHVLERRFKAAKQTDGSGQGRIGWAEGSNCLSFKGSKAHGLLLRCARRRARKSWDFYFKLRGKACSR